MVYFKNHHNPSDNYFEKGSPSSEHNPPDSPVQEITRDRNVYRRYMGGTGGSSLGSGLSSDSSRAVDASKPSMGLANGHVTAREITSPSVATHSITQARQARDSLKGAVRKPPTASPPVPLMDGLRMNGPGLGSGHSKSGSDTTKSADEAANAIRKVGGGGGVVGWTRPTRDLRVVNSASPAKSRLGGGPILPPNAFDFELGQAANGVSRTEGANKKEDIGTGRVGGGDDIGSHKHTDNEDNARHDRKIPRNNATTAPALSTAAPLESNRAVDAHRPPLTSAVSQGAKVATPRPRPAPHSASEGEPRQRLSRKYVASMMTVNTVGTTASTRGTLEGRAGLSAGGLANMSAQERALWDEEEARLDDAIAEAESRR
jgi:hypothetical protein